MTQDLQARPTGSTASPGSAVTLESRYRPRDNSIAAARLALALCVVLSHAVPLGGFGPTTQPSLFGIGLGSLSVAAFFVLSGFLITASRERVGVWRFAWQRALRILPGYWVCLVVTAAVIVPLGFGVGSPHAVIEYVKENALLSVHGNAIAGAPHGLPFPDSINGSLWTLRWECACYAAVAVIGLRHRLAPRLAVAMLAASSAALWAEHLGLAGRAHEPLMLISEFALGSCMYLYRSRIPMRRGLAALAVVAMVAVSWAGFFDVLGTVAAAYTCLYVATARDRTPLLRSVDLSYGVYIYAFPLQQALAAQHVQRLGYVAYAGAGIVLALMVGLASWLAVEAPALRLKKWRAAAG